MKQSQETILYLLCETTSKLHEFQRLSGRFS